MISVSRRRLMNNYHNRSIIMSSIPSRETFESMYAGKAPWDIGRPQRAFVEVADRVTGDLLDAGCGTGENALFFAERGHPVLGIDFLEGPIREARRKALERGLDAEFVQRDALTLTDLDRKFDTVIDSGLFHVFSDEDRARYVAGLAHVTRPGGQGLPALLQRRGARDPGPEASLSSGRSGSHFRGGGRWRRSNTHGWRCDPTWRTSRSARAGRGRGSR